MRRRSVTGPIFLIVFGLLFLFYNLRPSIPVFSLVAVYWPFLLIVWGTLRLLEVVAAASKGRTLQPGLTGGETGLIVLICLIGSGMHFAHRRGESVRFGPFRTGTLEVFGESFDYPVSAQASAGQARTVVLENLRGNIRFTGSDSGELKITGQKSVRAYSRSEADQVNNDTKVEIKTEGDRLIVRTNQEHAGNQRRISCDLEVAAPRALAIEARGSYGDYDVTDVAGSVRIDSDNAGVRLNRVGGDVRIDLRRSEDRKSVV